MDSKTKWALITFFLLFCLVVSSIVYFLSWSPKKAGRTAPHGVSSRAEKLLKDYKDIVREQERKRNEEQEAAAISEEEKLIQKTVDLMIDELLALDPQKDAERAGELAGDLYNIGPKALQALQTMFAEDRPPRQKILLTMAIGRFNNDEAQRQLFDQAINSKDKNLRDAALSNLRKAPNRGQLVNEAAGKFKETVNLRETDPQKQMAIIETLGALGGDSAASELYSIFRTSSSAPGLQKKAVEALGNIGGDYAKSVLFNIFAEEGPARNDAAEALGKMKDEEVTTMLGETLIKKESSLGAKIAAVKGLGADNGSLARKILSNLLQDTAQAREVHESAMGVLVSGHENLPLDELDTYINIFAKTSTDYLPQMFQPLLARGKDEFVSKFPQIYSDLSREKKIHAIRTLGMIHSREVLDTLRSKIGSEQDAGLQSEMISAIKACNTGDLKADAVDVIRGVAENSKDKNVKIEAIKNLAEISPNDAVRIAGITLYNEKDPDLARLSVDILGRYANYQGKDVLRSFLLSDIGKGLEADINRAIAAIEAREAK